MLIKIVETLQTIQSPGELVVYALYTLNILKRKHCDIKRNFSLMFSPTVN